MSHIVHLPLTAQDFRQHPAIDTEPRHWLLDSIYGRQLLKAKLRMERPELKVTLQRDLRELDPLLNVMIDMLDLRDWPKPRTLVERFKALRLHLQMQLDIEEGRPLRDWKALQAN